MSQYFSTGGARNTPVGKDAEGRARVVKGTMIAQRYGIGGKPWTSAPGRNGQKDWDLRQVGGGGEGGAHRTVWP